MLRPFVLMGVSNFFWDDSADLLVTTPVYPGVTAPCASIFNRVLYAAASPSQLGLVSDKICALHCYFFFFFGVFVLLLLFPVFEVWFRQMLSSGFSCLQYALPMTVSPKMALTFTTGPYRPFLAPLLLSLCWCRETLQKCFFWMLSVYIYSHKI